MTPSRSQIEKVAALASLELNQQELAGAEADFASILGYFDRLAQVPTEGVAAMLGVQPHHNVFRDDLVRPGLNPEQAVQNATTAERLAEDADGHCSHFFRIPRILE